MEAEHKNMISRRVKPLVKQLMDKEFRDSYMESHIKRFLANQIKALRGDKSQAEFGKILEKPQSVVSRLEDPEYGKVTLETLLGIASKLDVGLLVRFVNHKTFLSFTSDLSSDALAPSQYNHREIEELAEPKHSAQDLMQDAIQVTVTEAMKGKYLFDPIGNQCGTIIPYNTEKSPSTTIVYGDETSQQQGNGISELLAFWRTSNKPQRRLSA